jgi:RNA 2',3'-cyclic 3'-phosphodiesterase
MPETTRTFIAVAIPAPLGEKLTRLKARLAPEIPAVRWTSTLPFHVTLVFLGDVRNADLNQVCAVVSEAASPVPPFEVRVQGIGAFPNPARPRVIWAGLKSPEPSPLVQLRETIARNLARIGYRSDKDRFTPHATLGRIKPDRRNPPAPDLTKILSAYENWDAGTFTVRELTTFASTLTPQGPVYAPLAQARLAGKKNIASP